MIERDEFDSNSRMQISTMAASPSNQLPICKGQVWRYLSLAVDDS